MSNALHAALGQLNECCSDFICSLSCKLCSFSCDCTACTTGYLRLCSGQLPWSKLQSRQLCQIMQGERVAIVFGSLGSGVVASFWKSDLPKTFILRNWGAFALESFEANLNFKPKNMILWRYDNLQRAIWPMTHRFGNNITLNIQQEEQNISR